MRLVRHPLALTRDGDALAHRSLSVQSCREFAQPRGLVAALAHAAGREPGHAQQQHDEDEVLPVAPDRLQRRQPRHRADHRRQRATQRGLSAHRVRRGEDDEHERVRALSPGAPERAVERRREHCDAHEGHDRQSAAQGQRHRGEKGEGDAIRAEAIEHDFEFGRNQQRHGQGDVLDDARAPSRCGDAVHGPHECDGTEAAPRRHRPMAAVRSASGMSANPRSVGCESAGMAMADGPPIHSVAGMHNSITLKRCGKLLAGVAAVNALVFSPLGDEWFFAIALLGPIATGIVVGLWDGDTRLAAAAWAASGLLWLALDWIINQEDVAFHAVLAVVMAGLVGLGASIAHSARRHGSSARPRTAAGDRS
jgi:hypothetical protein